MTTVQTSDNSPIGVMDLRAFDRGIVEYTLRAQLIPYVEDQAERMVYAIPVRNVETNIPQFQGMVPVYFAQPEDVYSEWKLPCYVIRRNELQPNFARAPWFGWQRAPTTNAKRIYAVNPMDPSDVRPGWTEYVNRRSAYPFDIGYEVNVMARRSAVGLPMLQYALEYCYPPWFSMTCYDNLGERRVYDSGEVAVSSTSELTEISDRTVAWTISFSVRGELDLRGDYEYRKGSGLIYEFPDVNVTGKK